MSVPKVTSTFESPVSSPAASSSNKNLYNEVTIDNKKIFHCLLPDCGKAFKFLSEMKRHLTVHTKQRPYTCSFPECGKTFKRADALSNHFRIHSRNTPFNCTEEGCEAQFVTKSALRYHTLKHNGDRAFKCTQEGCDKVFMTQAQLKQHEKASVYHQRITGGSSPSVDNGSMSPREVSTNSQNGLQATEKDFHGSDSNEVCGRSDFLSYDYNFEGTTANEEDHLDSQSDTFNYLEHVYGQVSQSYDETSSVETNETSTIERLKKKNADPNLINMLNFIMEENRQLKKKLKTMNEVPRYESNSLEENQKTQSDIDSFFKTSGETDADQDSFLNFQPTFLY